MNKAFHLLPLGPVKQLFVRLVPHAQWEHAEDQLLQVDSMSGLSSPFHILNCHCVKCLVIKYSTAKKLQLYLSFFSL